MTQTANGHTPQQKELCLLLSAGQKPLVIRYQTGAVAQLSSSGAAEREAPEGSGATSALRQQGSQGLPEAIDPALKGSAATATVRPARSVAAGGEEEESDDDSLMPAVNLSNRLNPNNVHFDRQLAAQYKRMSKHEKEALWAADRARQHQLRELTELSQMAGLSSTEVNQLTELTQVRGLR